jgi:addiction module HigA family antidote
MLPKNRPPTPPGEVLLEEFLKPADMTQTALAERMGVPVQRVNLLIKGKRAVTAETALLLAKVFATSPEFWMNLQARWDLWHARRELERR